MPATPLSSELRGIPPGPLSKDVLSGGIAPGPLSNDDRGTPGPLSKDERGTPGPLSSDDRGAVASVGPVGGGSSESC